MQLGIADFQYEDLSTFAGLARLATAFDRFVEEHDAELFQRFDTYRHGVQSGAPDAADVRMSSSSVSSMRKTA